MRTLKGQITPKKVNGQYTSKKRWKDNAQVERARHNFKNRWKDNAHTERAPKRKMKEQYTPKKKWEGEKMKRYTGRKDKKQL